MSPITTHDPYLVCHIDIATTLHSEQGRASFLYACNFLARPFQRSYATKSYGRKKVGGQVRVISLLLFRASRYRDTLDGIRLSVPPFGQRAYHPNKFGLAPGRLAVSSNPTPSSEPRSSSRTGEPVMEPAVSFLLQSLPSQTPGLPRVPCPVEGGLSSATP